MGFFKNIFSSGKKKENKIKYNLRQTKYKNEEYFLRELQRIDKWEASYKLNQDEYLKNNDKLLPSHFNASYKLMFQKTEVYYSIGIEISNIQKGFKGIFMNFFKGFEEEQTLYIDFLNLVSLSILLNIDTDFNKISNLLFKAQENKNNTFINSDKLLWFLMNFKLDQPKVISDQKGFSKLTRLLSKAIESNNEEAIKLVYKYLNDWYSLNKEMPWYDSHKRQWGYSGYWCWEAAAVVKVMGLDDASFKEHPHYPYDIVHWQHNGNV